MNDTYGSGGDNFICDIDYWYTSAYDKIVIMLFNAEPIADLNFQVI